MNSFDYEQVSLLNEVDTVRGRSLGPKRTGLEVCVVASNYIRPHLPNEYELAGPNSFLDDLPIEFDLLVVRKQAVVSMSAYKPSDVRVVLEIKTAGIRATEAEYPLRINKIRSTFDSAKKQNPLIWGALLMCYGTVHPKRTDSIDYEKMRIEGLVPFGYGAYTLAQSDQIQWGKWELFMKRLLLAL